MRDGGTTEQDRDALSSSAVPALSATPPSGSPGVDGEGGGGLGGGVNE